MKDGEVMYLVKWFGFEECENTWEFEDDIVDIGWKQIQSFQSTKKGTRKPKPFMKKKIEPEIVCYFAS